MKRKHALTVHSLRRKLFFYAYPMGGTLKQTADTRNSGEKKEKKGEQIQKKPKRKKETLKRKKRGPSTRGVTEILSLKGRHNNPR